MFELCDNYMKFHYHKYVSFKSSIKDFEFCNTVSNPYNFLTQKTLLQVSYSFSVAHTWVEKKLGKIT